MRKGGGFDVAEVLEKQLQKGNGGVRDIDAVTDEILRAKQRGGEAILTIGRCLIEAKGMLDHGQWLSWLSERVEFSESTSQRFMRLAREWSNPSALTDLGATKALTLLALPAEEREKFIAENHIVNGEEKSVIDMTSRELEKAVRERDEARAAAEKAKSDASVAEEARAKMESDMVALKKLHENSVTAEEQARKELESVRAELKTLREKPVEVAVEQVADPGAIEKARKEAAAEMQAKVEKAEESLRKAEEKRKAAEAAVKTAKEEGAAESQKKLDAAREELEAVRARLEALEKEGKQSALASDPELSTFKVLFEQVQEQVNKMRGILLKVRGRDDAESAEKLARALTALSDVVRRCAE